ncbi:MAG: NAD(P)H-binding protein [Gammaproteobacteria bacterium]|jgi:uncharacterized protein YbjT (DUF2867 family)|nr:NAD(P)H-binding protein [Gammaproteobacteria bacterium]MBT4494353.1 NAD(P)H-binding protein [Gammaproteobacteria bacterium]MBT7370146.1 NAD(P)H-binding protein [Gammaproteobacteria bacterium]
MRIVITGANGHVGRRLIRRLSIESPQAEIVALVRSSRAVAEIRDDGLNAEIHIVDYADASAISEAVGECDVVVHLVGIIKESKSNTFQSAHEASCRALIAANLRSAQIVCLGVVGTSLDSSNACFRSRASAEQILFSGTVPTTVIRVPMVLGPDDYASYALAKNARKKLVFTFRGTSLEQPIFSEDVTSAIISAIRLTPGNRVLELGGPESVSRSELIRRAGTFFQNRPRVVSIPFGVGYVIAGLLERLLSSPPVTTSMLGVLDHDDLVNVEECCQLLDLRLTSLDEMLSSVLTEAGSSSATV